MPEINAHVEIDWDSRTVKHAKTGGFICKKHNEPLKFFSMDDNLFVCSLCCFDQKITRDEAYVCQQNDIIAHAQGVIEHLNALKASTDAALKEMQDIAGLEKEIEATELSKQFNNSAKILTGYLDKQEDVMYVDKFKDKVQGP